MKLQLGVFVLYCLKDAHSWCVLVPRSASETRFRLLKRVSEVLLKRVQEADTRFRLLERVSEVLLKRVSRNAFRETRFFTKKPLQNPMFVPRIGSAAGSSFITSS